jgi:hypothetical protein
MEKWYQRAMEADPDNLEACRQKMYYLEPKWHGSAAEMLEFGKQCFETRNWHGSIAFLLVDAHQSLSKYAPDAGQYFANDAVWSDIATVYSAYLDAYPDNNVVRSRYTAYACVAQKWTEANEQFNKLGDKADPSAFGTAGLMQGLKKQAAENAAKP